MEHILVRNFGINQIFGALLLAIICYIVLLGNIEKITKINKIIIPALIIFIVSIGILNLKTIKLDTLVSLNSVNKGNSWVIQAILYASYNLILLIPVLVNLKGFIKSRKQIKYVSIISSSIISIISIMIFFLLQNVDVPFENLEMPAVYVIKCKFPNIAFLYGGIILVAIFTTATSIGASFLNNISIDQKTYNKYAFFMCLISVIISSIRFSNLVKILFPMFGYVGILQIVLLLCNKHSRK